MWSLSLSSQSLKPLCVLYKTDLSKKIKSQKLYNTKKQNIIVILDTWIQFYQLFSPAHLQRPQWFLSMGNWAIRVALRFYLHLNLLHDELVWNCDKPNKTISSLPPDVNLYNQSAQYDEKWATEWEIHDQFFFRCFHSWLN